MEAAIDGAVAYAFTYRSQVSFDQSAYNQPPHTGFHIGAGTADPPGRIYGSSGGEGGCRCTESLVGATLKRMTHVARVQQIVEEVRQLPAHDRMDVLRGVVGLVAPALSAEQENGIAEALDEAERGETVDGVAGLATARKRGSVLPGAR